MMLLIVFVFILVFMNLESIRIFQSIRPRPDRDQKIVGVGKTVDYRKKYYFFHWP